MRFGKYVTDNEKSSAVQGNFTMSPEAIAKARAVSKPIQPRPGLLQGLVLAVLNKVNRTKLGEESIKEAKDGGSLFHMTDLEVAKHLETSGGYNIRYNPDGTADVIGLMSPTNKNWIGQPPTANTSNRVGKWGGRVNKGLSAVGAGFAAKDIYDGISDINKGNYLNGTGQLASGGMNMALAIPSIQKTPVGRSAIGYQLSKDVLSPIETWGLNKIRGFDENGYTGSVARALQDIQNGAIAGGAGFGMTGALVGGIAGGTKSIVENAYRTGKGLIDLNKIYRDAADTERRTAELQKLYEARREAAQKAKAEKETASQPINQPDTVTESPTVPEGNKQDSHNATQNTPKPEVTQPEISEGYHSPSQPEPTTEPQPLPKPVELPKPEVAPEKPTPPQPEVTQQPTNIPPVSTSETPKNTNTIPTLGTSVKIPNEIEIDSSVKSPKSTQPQVRPQPQPQSKPQPQVKPQANGQMVSVNMPRALGGGTMQMRAQTPAESLREATEARRMLNGGVSPNAPKPQIADNRMGHTNEAGMNNPVGQTIPLQGQSRAINIPKQYGGGTAYSRVVPHITKKSSLFRRATGLLENGEDWANPEDLKYLRKYSEYYNMSYEEYSRLPVKVSTNIYEFVKTAKLRPSSLYDKLKKG